MSENAFGPGTVVAKNGLFPEQELFPELVGV
jgi:hypothetical protein